MTKAIQRLSIALLCSCGLAFSATANVMSVNEADFAGATTEVFDQSLLITNSMHLSSGFTLSILSGLNDLHIGKTGSWGMGSQSVTNGIDNDGFLGIQGHSASSQTTVVFEFDQPTHLFGLYGVESSLFGYGGTIGIEFFDKSQNAIDSFVQVFGSGPTWEEFNGWRSSTAIAEVRFTMIGTAAFDNVMFVKVPEPASVAIGLAALGLLVRRRNAVGRSVVRNLP
ncbi:MAG: PEP-CTERM sorting domain-containing protein [Planctomycetales bacterium]|nr:PEP-CTERM sorting domain-containing protein [Planctomycetales bacterium]